MTRGIIAAFLVALTLMLAATPAQSKGRPQMSLVLSDVGSQHVTGYSGLTSLITVPADEYWKLTSIRGLLATTATAGNRMPIFDIYDAGDTNTHRIFAINAPTPASSFIHLQSGETDVAPFVLNGAIKYAQFAFEPFMLGPGSSIDAEDFAGIDNAGDIWTMVVRYEIWRQVPDAQHVVIDSGIPSTLEISSSALQAIVENGVRTRAQ